MKKYAARVSAAVASAVIFCLVQNLYSQGDCVPAPPGLLSWWRAEGNALDAQDGNNGTLVGAVSYVSGEVGQAFLLGGRGAMVQVGYATNFQLQDFSIEGWIRCATNLGPASLEGDQEIFGYGSGGYIFAVHGDGRLFLSKVQSDAVYFPAAITDTNFHHVAVTKAGSNVIAYLDGVAYSAAPYTNIFVFTSPVAIGNRGDGIGNDGFYGEIDELAVYNRALESNEVGAIFAAGSAGKCLSSRSNLLVNGNFELGNVGFTSEYTYSPGNLIPEDDYDVIANPYNDNPGQLSMGDHTSGHGLMLVVNGGPDPSQFFWSETVNVLTDTTYAFSGWATDVDAYDSSPPQLVFSINGTQVGNQLDISPYGNEWRSFYIPWNSQSSTQAVIQIRDVNTVANGNDFALDDLVFQPIAPNLVVEFQPETLQTNQGANIAFSVTATGTAPLQYQWLFDGNPLAGATNSTLALANVQTNQSGAYAVIVSNPAGSIPCYGDFLIVLVPPTITKQPTNMIVKQGSNATFTVGAIGSSPLSYQWLFNNAPLSGETAPSLAFSLTGLSNIGYYSVVVSNVAGTVTSSNASLTFLDLRMYAELTLTGPSGTNFGIQSTPALGKTNWTTLTNVIMGTQPFLYIDYGTPTNPVQFYRAFQVP